jgi:ABC-2 type transport system ATP-binding protein
MKNSLPAITIEGLRVLRGGHEVIHGLDLTVPSGEIVGLLGPNGCGKTTLIRSIMGVQVVAGGSVTVLGHPAGSAPLRKRMGYAAQTPSVYGDLSVTENLRYFASVLRAPRSDVDRVIDEVGLAASAHRQVGQLSEGQRGRASLAVALLGTPELLVLDEPTVGVDPLLREELWQLFRLLRRRGVTLLVSSHVIDEASRCDRLLLMHEGRVIAARTPEELRARTGQYDLEQVFLTLIRGGPVTAESRHAPVRGRHEKREDAQ